MFTMHKKGISSVQPQFKCTGIKLSIYKQNTDDTSKFCHVNTVLVLWLMSAHRYHNIIKSVPRIAPGISFF